MPRAKKPSATRRRSPAKAPPPPTAATGPAAGSPADIEEAIRRRAYELYEQRGREGGHALEDWLEAEAEVRGLEGEG